MNVNRDPQKSQAVKPSDFFYFTSEEEEGVNIPSSAANAFFALADAGKLPGWCVAIAPVDKLVKAQNSQPCNPVVWTGEGVVLINPVVNSGVVRFPLGFVEKSGAIATSGGVVKVPEIGESWILDGEFQLKAEG